LLYLNKEDAEILNDAVSVLFTLFMQDKLSGEQKKVLARLQFLLIQSGEYTINRRTKAKKLVQEKRKTDKTYAHTRKKKNKEVKS